MPTVSEIFFQHLIVCLEEKIFVHHIRDMKVSQILSFKKCFYIFQSGLRTTLLIFFYKEKAKSSTRKALSVVAGKRISVSTCSATEEKESRVHIYRTGPKLHSGMTFVEVVQTKIIR